MFGRLQLAHSVLGHCSSFSGCDGMKYVDTSGYRMRDGLRTMTRSQVQHTLCTCRVHMHYGDLHSAFQTKRMWPCALNWRLIAGRAEPNMQPSQIKSLK